jgi:hypothetical protein
MYLPQIAAMRYVHNANVPAVLSQPRLRYARVPGWGLMMWGFWGMSASYDATVCPAIVNTAQDLVKN